MQLFAERQRNVFIIGLNDRIAAQLRRLPRASEYELHELLPLDALRGVEDLPFSSLLDEGREVLRKAALPVDAIAAFIDFPAIELAAALGREWNLKTPSLEGILQCNHKLWSRRLQHEAAPEVVPRFAGFDPFDDRELAYLEEVVGYPFWIKPLNAYRSHLGFRVDGPADFRSAMPEMRAGIGRLADPLEEVIAHARVPDEISELPPWICLAESIIGGRQCTLEGYVQDGLPHIYAVVDSVREPGMSSFAGYYYPSTLPAEVQERMSETAKRIMHRLDFDHGCFNVEFFYDEGSDRLWLLEINPRLSQSHCELLEDVDGASNQQIALDIALGDAPRPPHRQGRFRCGAKLFVRAFADARVRRVPSAADLERIRNTLPGVTVEVLVDFDEQLSELTDQDAYSYELAWIWIGADDFEQINERFEACKRMLGFELERATSIEPTGSSAPRRHPPAAPHRAGSPLGTPHTPGASHNPDAPHARGRGAQAEETGSTETEDARPGEDTS